MTRTTRHLLSPHHERGSILGLAAISMTALLLAVGLCIDVGHWYLVAGELQNAADAAALAATSALDGSSGGITQAVDRAVATVNKYEFNGLNAVIARSDVRFAAQVTDFDTGTGMSEATAQGSPANIRFVQVTVPPKSVNVFFATLATGSSTISLSRKAVAGLASVNTFGNIIPLAFVENQVGGANLTSSCSNQGPQFTKGCIYNLNVNNLSKAPVGGDYLILDLSSSRTSGSLSEYLALGSDGYVKSGQVIPLRTGKKVGQLGDGLDTRFDNSNLDPITFPPDANIREGITRAQYRNPDYFTAPAHTGVWDRRVFVVPIVANTPSQFDGSANTITPIKFGAFFMVSKVGTGQPTLRVEYMGSPAVIGNGGFDPSGGAGTPDITTAVLYR